MTKSSDNNTKTKKVQINMVKTMSTTTILLSVIAFVLSSALINGNIIRVLAAPSIENGSSSNNHTTTLAHTLVQNLTKTLFRHRIISRGSKFDIGVIFCLLLELLVGAGYWLHNSE